MPNQNSHAGKGKIENGVRPSQMTQSIAGSGAWQSIRKFIGILSACAIAGALIGAADGAATVISTFLYHDRVYVGAERLSAIAVWAGRASVIGIVAGALVGLPVYYAVFAGRVSAREFMNIALISLIGGVAVCLVTGEFAIELSWLATPLVTVLSSLTLARRRAPTVAIGGTP